MKKMSSLFLALLLIAGLGNTVHAGSRGRSLIVMPVRYTVVQFAFDVARIRPVDLLAYDQGTEDEPVLLHAWDADAHNWKPADISAYQDGTLFTAKPKRVFLVGGADLPPELATEPGWAKQAIPIASLKVLDMANAMGSELKFSGREWKRLAKRHNLELVDENEDRRRYGRYGKPGTEYTGPRPVNPLVARFREIMKDDAPAEAEPLEAPVEIEAAESDDAETGDTEAPAVEESAEEDAVTATEEAVKEAAPAEEPVPEPEATTEDTPGVDTDEATEPEMSPEDK